MKTLLIGLLATLPAAQAAASLPADTTAAATDIMERDYRFISDRDAWYTAPNAAGLIHFAHGHISEATIDAGHEWGGLCDYHESPSTMEWGAAVESYYRLSRRTVVHGAMSYQNFSGKRMAGSVFIEPLHMPFDIMEDSLDNTGRKHRDTYRLMGAIGTDVGHGVALGAKVDFTAANYAKYKDLRHKNSYMLLDVTAGVAVPLGHIARIGAHYWYRRNTETVSYKTYGTTDRDYKSLISYAAFTGEVETFGQNGFTGSSFEKPYFDESHGLGAQLSICLSPRLSLYNELTYRHRQGYYGSLSQYTIRYTKHNGNVIAYRGRLQYDAGKALHTLTVTADVDNQKNLRNTYRETAADNAATYYEYFEPLKTANKVIIDFSAAYVARLGVSGEQALWTLGATFTRRRIKQTAYSYPQLRRQRLATNTFTLSAERIIALRHRHSLTPALALSYQKGTGDPYEDALMGATDDATASLAEMTAYLYRNYEYLTLGRMGLDASLRYALPVPRTLLKAFASLRYSLRSASSAQWLEGSTRQYIGASVGCTF